MRGNFQIGGLVNPSQPVRQKPIIASVYVNQHTRLTLFQRHAIIRRGGFGRHYWYFKGKRLCPVYKDKGTGRWVISHK